MMQNLNPRDTIIGTLERASKEQLIRVGGSIRTHYLDKKQELERSRRLTNGNSGEVQKRVSNIERRSG
jgi:hypothetical protein